MKQYLIAIAMVLALSSNANVSAQKHRHTPRTEQVSDTVKNNQDAIEAFSDTTAAKANANVNDEDDNYTTRHHVTYEADDEEVGQIVKSVFSGIGGAAFLIPILAILCFGFFLPIIILILVFYFINRNRKEKYRLAQMAIQNGQPIPDELLKETYTTSNSKEYNEGIRQMFTGVGLAIFLGIILDELGVGIGALVFFIGLGKFIIARQGQKNENLNDMRQNYENNPKNDEL